MARLTDTTYLATHRELRSVWLEDPARFAILNASEQWALHGYFAPEHNLSDDRLLAYRHEVSKVDTSLPQRAGRAYTQWRLKKALLDEYRRHSQVPALSRKRSRKYTVTVFSHVHTEIDSRKITRALLAAFREHEQAKNRPRSHKL